MAQETVHLVVRGGGQFALFVAKQRWMLIALRPGAGSMVALGILRSPLDDEDTAEPSSLEEMERAVALDLIPLL